VTEPDASASQFSLRTVWARRLETPLRRFLRTETGGAAVLLAATVAALAWANIDPSGYAATWHTVLMIRSGTRGLADSWQGWVNSGLHAHVLRQRQAAPGAYDTSTLSDAVRTARTRVLISSPRQPRRAS
jgi:hypothetical protein